MVKQLLHYVKKLTSRVQYVQQTAGETYAQHTSAVNTVQVRVGTHWPSTR